jgi:hypothetical protein
MNKSIKIRDCQYHLENKIIEMMKNVYYNDAKLIDREDQNNIYSGFTKLNVIFNKNSVNDCLFNDNNKFMITDQRLKRLEEMLCFGNIYSEKILDQIFNFLIQAFSLILENPLNDNDVVQKVRYLVYVIAIYTQFDYTSNENYLKNFILFENLNNEIYKRIFQGNLKVKDLNFYVESLIGLNLFVESAFNDVLKLNIGVNNFLKSLNLLIFK